MKKCECTVCVDWDYIEEDLADKIFENSYTDVMIYSILGQSYFEFVDKEALCVQTIGAIVMELHKYGLQVASVDVSVVVKEKLA